MIKFGTNNIGKIYFGSNLIEKAYFGSNLVYSSGSSPVPDPDPDPDPGTETGYTVFGNPAITDGLMTISGGQNGIMTLTPFNPGSQTWEIQTRVLYKFTRYSELFRSCDANGSNSGVYGIMTQMDNAGVRFIYSINGTSWVSTTGIQIRYTADAWNYVKVGWNGSKYYHMISLDGVTWTMETSNNTNPVHPGDYILFGSTESNQYSQSTWDLNSTQILIGGMVRWRAVGSQ